MSVWEHRRPASAAAYAQLAGAGLVVKLDIAIPGVEREEAEKLVAEAHEVCPYSHATKGNIDVTLNVL